LRSSTVLALVLLALTSGCGGDKSSVALSARAEQPTLDVQSSSVGADVTGGFNLTMELGEYASADTEVSLGVFSIERSGTELLSPLALSGAKFPLTLGVGKKITLPLTFDVSSEPTVADSLCLDAVELRGTLTDSLSHDHPTIVLSSPFSATCQ